MSRVWMCVCVSVSGLIYPPVRREVVFYIQYSWSRAHGSSYSTHCSGIKTIYSFVLTDAWRPMPHYHQHDRGRNRQYKKKMLNYFSTIDGQPRVLFALSRWSLHEYLFFHCRFSNWSVLRRIHFAIICIIHSMLLVVSEAQHNSINDIVLMFIPLCILEKCTKQKHHIQPHTNNLNAQCQQVSFGNSTVYL